MRVKQDFYASSDHLFNTICIVQVTIKRLILKITYPFVEEDDSTSRLMKFGFEIPVVLF